MQQAHPSGKTQCSAWSLLGLEENPSDNGRNEEEDGEVGGSASHKAHCGSNIELPENSEITSTFDIATTKGRAGHDAHDRSNIGLQVYSETYNLRQSKT